MKGGQYQVPVHWNIVLGRRTTGNSLMQKQIGTVAVPVTEHRVLTESLIPAEGISLGFCRGCFSSRTNFDRQGVARMRPLFLIADTRGGELGHFRLGLAAASSR